MAKSQIKLGTMRCEREATTEVARRAPSAIVRAADAAGLLCDARVLLTVGAVWLLADHSARASRRGALRFASTIGVTTAFHHAIKRIISQQRPDRSISTGLGKKTGRPFDAMPSGHAMHAGAIASLMDHEFGGGGSAWLAAGALAATRVLTLAHWPSGVLVGFLLGICAERCTRATFRRVEPQAWPPSQPETAITATQL